MLPSTVTEARPTIGVVGLGAFGRLTAATLAEHADVLAHDTHPVDDPPTGVRLAPIQDVAAAEAVVLAVNLQHLPEAIDAIGPHLREGALVADVCSVKIRPAELLLGLPEHGGTARDPPALRPANRRRAGARGPADRPVPGPGSGATPSPGPARS